MFTDWNELSPALFEKLCAAVLSSNGYKNVQWFGESGSDKGRDIIAEKTDTPVPGIERTEKWLIQCKRYTAKKFTKVHLKDLLDTALEHDVDNVLVIVTASISANVRDWLKAAIEKYPFGAFIWEELDFRREVLKHKSQLIEDIPELTSGREPIWIYPMSSNEMHFRCNEIEEVELRVVNVSNLEEAKAKATEFLNYLKSNGFEWWD